MQGPRLMTHDSHLTMETGNAGITIVKQSDHMTPPHHLVMEISVPILTVKQRLAVCTVLYTARVIWSGLHTFFVQAEERNPLETGYVLLHLGFTLLLGGEVEASANAVEIECMILFWFELCNLWFW